MVRVEWEPALETGNEQVDRQHRQLFTMLDEIVRDVELRAADNTMASVLERLSEYVAVHFACEEALMVEIAFPQDLRSAHTDEHQRLTHRTRDMVLRWRDGGASPLELVDFLCEWLIDHIHESDQKLADAVRDVRSAAESLDCEA